jgi:hypothetical protein
MIIFYVIKEFIDSEELCVVYDFCLKNAAFKTTVQSQPDKLVVEIYFNIILSLYQLNLTVTVRYKDRTKISRPIQLVIPLEIDQGGEDVED